MSDTKILTPSKKPTKKPITETDDMIIAIYQNAVEAMLERQLAVYSIITKDGEQYTAIITPLAILQNTVGSSAAGGKNGI